MHCYNNCLWCVWCYYPYWYQSFETMSIPKYVHKIITVWMFLILFILCMYDTRSVFSMNRINLVFTQGFARSSTLASSGVREDVFPTNKLELCWKIFQYNSNLLVGWTSSLTPEEARVEDLAKPCVETKFILFIEKTDLVSYIHKIMLNTYRVMINIYVKFS